MVPPTKDEWRRRAKAGRATLTIDHDAHVEALRVFLADLEPSPRWVLTYHPMPGEVDLDALLEPGALTPGDRTNGDGTIRFAVTRTPTDGVALTVHPTGGPTERHRYGFEQPTAHSPTVAVADIDVALVPGLAFDRLGNRLGHGAGYYDRLLARLRPGIPLVGITGGYVVAELPVADHDEAMTHLCGPFGVEPTPLVDPEG